MKRITPAIRREAALMAATMASSRGDFSTQTVAASVGVSQEAVDLYWDAWAYAQRDSSHERGRVNWFGSPVFDAEAEALLRTGYVPEGWTT